jgi:hypothetical protein
LFMKSKAIAKVAAVATGLAMATSMLSLAPIAHAAALTSTQVSSILGLLSSFGANSATIANVNAALTGTTVTSGSTTTTGSSSCTFSRSLTVGSTGADVTGLQQALIAGGFSISAGATGYFGTQTRTAVAAWQSSKNIAPAVGYFGPISRAAFNLNCGSSSTTTTTTTTTTSTVAGCVAGAAFSATTGQACVTTSVAGCVAGAAFSATTGQACGTTTTTTTGGGVITTVGAEGSFTAVQAAQPANNTNVTTNTNTSVYGVQIKATGSDMIIGTASLEFAVTVNTSAINPAGFITSISAWDGSTLLKTMPLASTDFTKGSTNLYTVRMTGIGFFVPKDATKSLTFSINTNAVSSSDYTRLLTVNGDSTTLNDIRGVDGAGLNSYANLSWVGTFTFQASNNAVLTGTLNSSSPKAQTIATTSTGVQGVTMQVFDLKSTTGNSVLTNLVVNVNTDGATNSKPTAIYLYDGSTLLSSAVPGNYAGGTGYATSSNLSVAIAMNATKTLTVKADFPASAVGVASTSIATTPVTSAQFTTADGSTRNVTINSAIVGNDVHILGAAMPTWTLVSASIAPTAGVVNSASSTLTGTIVLNVKATGGSVTKPVVGNFSVWFASSTALTTNGGAGYTAANGIQLTGATVGAQAPTVTVSPTDASVGDGGSYTVTIVGVLASNNASFGSSQSLFMAINSITTAMVPTSGSITTQNWGIDSFITPSAYLPKGTL